MSVSGDTASQYFENGAGAYVPAHQPMRDVLLCYICGCRRGIQIAGEAAVPAALQQRITCLVFAELFRNPPRTAAALP